MEVDVPLLRKSDDSLPVCAPKLHTFSDTGGQSFIVPNSGIRERADQSKAKRKAPESVSIAGHTDAASKTDEGCDGGERKKTCRASRSVSARSVLWDKQRQKTPSTLTTVYQGERASIPGSRKARDDIDSESHGVIDLSKESSPSHVSTPNCEPIETSVEHSKWAPSTSLSDIATPQQYTRGMGDIITSTGRALSDVATLQENDPSDFPDTVQPLATYAQDASGAPQLQTTALHARHASTQTDPVFSTGPAIGI